MGLDYNENAYSLSWEVLNNEENIGKWVLYGGEQIIEGIGIESFLKAVVGLSDLINVVFLKDVRWFLIIVSKFIDLKDKNYASSKNRFFYIQILDNLELREIKNFWEDCDEEMFLKRLEICRDVFRPRQKRYSKEYLKNKVSIKSHYKFTLASEMWNQMDSEYFLQGRVKYLVTDLLPQNEKQLEIMTERLNKASFCWVNPKYQDTVVTKLGCYDLSSSHLSFFARKKFPYEPFQEVTDSKEISEILHGNYWAWMGMFYFEGLKWKTDFKFNMQGFTYWAVRDTAAPSNWYVSLTNVDYEWFRATFKWDACYPCYFCKSRQKELPKDLAVMFEDIYARKQVQKKGTFARDIYKFRAELPYGQPMKSIELNGKLVYFEDEKSFEPVNLPSEMTFEEKIKKLTARSMPYAVSLWVVAYSRAEWFHVASRIGWDNVVYGDTDSVYFLGTEGHEIIRQRNEEIKEEFHIINEKRKLYFDERLGKWDREEDVKMFKAIGKKWYIKEDVKGKFTVTCAGVNNDLLAQKLQDSGAPFVFFDSRRMKDWELFPYIKKVGVHSLEIGFNKFNDEKRKLKVEDTALY